MDKFWKQFKSGTDIRGVASEGVAGQKINLTDEVGGKDFRRVCFVAFEKSE